MSQFLTLTQGKILFLLSVAFAAGACWCLWLWWQAFSILLITGFISFAQDSISAYFESDSDDPWIERTVFIIAIGYVALFFICMWRRNEMAGGELFGAFILFLGKIRKETFGQPPARLTMEDLTPVPPRSQPSALSPQPLQ